MFKRLAILFLLLAAATGAAQAQTASSDITLAAHVGFDGSFRENKWMPVYVRVSNSGEAVEGRLVVRPETSGNAVYNTYDFPISLPTGSQKSVFLYITARGFANEIRVELINNDGVILAVEPTQVRSLQARDQLHVVVTQSTSGAIDFATVHDAGYNAFQANWRVENIPDRAAALDAVDTLIFSDIDTGTLSSAQQQAITDWVAQGGHLLVTGGTDWQRTAAGLADLLPLSPANSITLDHLTPLAEWLRFNRDQLTQRAVVATGTVQSGATVLATGDNDTPLLVRGNLGSGTVDYLAASPSALPLRGWGGLGALWLTLATTVQPQPGWSYGFIDWDRANSAVNILPGVNLLPDILPLCGFLALYIALIGPLNYLVLNRLNRREYAWVTIPIFIMAFSALAWVLGFNLRGSEVTLSRLTVVQSWPDVERSAVQEVVGLLSPRRAQYSLSASNDSFLWPVPSIEAQNSFLSGNVQSSVNIEQAADFRAVSFPVDASFIAAFNAQAIIAKPDMGGQATLFHDSVSGQQMMRGSVRNDSEFVLNDPVILVRGTALHLAEPLAPGDVTPFEITLPGEGPPSPSPLAYAEGAFTSVYQRSYSPYFDNDSRTVEDIMGDALDNRSNRAQRTLANNAEQQEITRRRSFLAALISEPYRLLTGRGNQAYLVGWTDIAPLGLTLEGGTWKSLDTTLHLVQLVVEVTLPTDETVVTSDQFTWFVQSRTALNDVGPLDISFSPNDEVVFRFTPLPGIVLKSVTELAVLIDRQLTQARNVPVELWNWRDEEWELMDNSSEGVIAVPNPGRFLGPENSVQVRITAEAIGGYPRLEDVSIEQRGTF